MLSRMARGVWLRPSVRLNQPDQWAWRLTSVLCLLVWTHACCTAGAHKPTARRGGRWTSNRAPRETPAYRVAVFSLQKLRNKGKYSTGSCLHQCSCKRRNTCAYCAAFPPEPHYTAHIYCAKMVERRSASEKDGVVRGVSALELEEHTVSALRLNIKNAEDCQGVHGTKVRASTCKRRSWPAQPVTLRLWCQLFSRSPGQRTRCLSHKFARTL